MTAIAAPPKTRRSLMKYWYAYIGCLLGIWILLMLSSGLLPQVLHQWRIAVVMALGSFVAGSTPMGGGAVSFPFLVLWLHVPPDSARNFALSIQSAGMTSAMIFILCRRVPIQGRALLWTTAGAGAGMFLGTIMIAPQIAPNFVKLTFACVWMSFAILTVFRNREFCSITGVLPMSKPSALGTGLLAGIVGGIIASIIGVGVEMVLYTVLVLLYRCDLKIAVPTAVAAMGATSVMGIGIHLALADVSRDTALKFLAAGPIVIFGAPIGAYVLTLVSRAQALYFISFLCTLQFVWMLYSLQRTSAEWIFVVVAIGLSGVIISLLYRRGKREFSFFKSKAALPSTPGDMEADPAS